MPELLARREDRQKDRGGAFRGHRACPGAWERRAVVRMAQYDDTGWLREIKEYWAQISAKPSKVPVVVKEPASPGSVQGSSSLKSDVPPDPSETAST